MNIKPVLGLVEPVRINGKNFLAKVDTGADISSIDEKLANQLNIVNVVGNMRFKNAHGSRIRQLIECNVDIHGRLIKTRFSMANRSQLKYKILLGKNILEGFLIDVNKE